MGKKRTTGEEVVVIPDGDPSWGGDGETIVLDENDASWGDSNSTNIAPTRFSTPIAPSAPAPAVPADPMLRANIPAAAETTQVALPKDIRVLTPAQIEQQQHDSDMGGLQSVTPVFSAPPSDQPGVDPKWSRVMEDYRSARGNKDLGIPEKDMTPGYAGTALRERALEHQMRLLGQRKERYERALQGEARRGRGVQQPRIEAIDQEVAPILAKLEQGARLSGEETTQYLTLKAEREQLAGAYNAEMAPFVTEGKELQAAHQYLTTKLQENAVAAAKDPKQIELAKIQRISDERFRMAQGRVKKAEGPLATTLMMHDPLVLSEYLAKPVYDEVLRFGGNVGATTLRATARLGKATTPGDQNIGTIGLDDAANWFSDGLRRLEADKPKKLKTGLFADDWSINEGVLPKFMQGATYMSLLAVGGEAGGVAGMTGMSMVGSSDDYYREGKDAGMSDGEAEGFAFLMSGIEAGVENINRGPFVSGAARKELAKRALKNIRAGKPMKSAWLEIPKYLVEQGIQEGPVEEVLTALGQNALKSGANGLVDSNLDTDLTIQSLASDAAMGAALGGLMASGKTISYRPLYKESVRWAVDNQEEFEAWAQENVKEEELPNVLAKLEQYAKIYRGIPPEVPADKAANIAAAIAEKEAIKEQQKDQVLDPVVAAVAGDPLGDRITEIDETIIKPNLSPAEPVASLSDRDRQKALAELKPDGLTHRDRKRIIAQASLEDVPLREAHKRAGYKDVGGIMVSPDADASLLGAVHPDVWQAMVDRGISYIENSGTKGHGGALSRMHGGELSFGLDLSTELSEYVQEKEKDFPGIMATRVNHVIAHEIGHKVWQNDLTDEQRAVVEKAAKGSLYARNLESGVLKSAASIAEENFCENFAWDLTQRLTGQSEDRVQPDLKSLIDGLVKPTKKEDAEPDELPADSGVEQPSVGPAGKAEVDGRADAGNEAEGERPSASGDVGSADAEEEDQGPKAGVDVEAEQEEGADALPDDRSGLKDVSVQVIKDDKGRTQTTTAVAKKGSDGSEVVTFEAERSDKPGIKNEAASWIYDSAEDLVAEHPELIGVAQEQVQDLSEQHKDDGGIKVRVREHVFDPATGKGRLVADMVTKAGSFRWEGQVSGVSKWSKGSVDDRITPRPDAVEQLGEDRTDVSFGAVRDQATGHLDAAEKLRSKAFSFDEVNPAKAEKMRAEADAQDELALATISEFANIATKDDVERLRKAVFSERISRMGQKLSDFSKGDKVMRAFDGKVYTLTSDQNRQGMVTTIDEDGKEKEWNAANNGGFRLHEKAGVSTTVNTPEAKPPTDIKAIKAKGMDKSVRDLPQSVKIQDGNIEVTSKVGRQTAGKVTIPLQEWLEAFDFANPNYTKREVVRKYMEEKMDEDGTNPDRIYDSVISAIDRAFKAAQLDAATIRKEQRGSGMKVQSVSEVIRPKFANEPIKTVKVGERFKSGTSEVEITGAWPAVDGTPTVEYAFVQKDGSLGAKQRKSAAEFARLFHKHVEFKQPDAKPEKKPFANLSEEKRKRALELEEKLKKLSGRLTSGLDPERFMLGAEYTALVLEDGARGFAEYARVMVDRLGDWIKPHLKSLYSAARYAPGTDPAALSPDSEVAAADVDAILNETPNEDGTGTDISERPASGEDTSGVDAGERAGGDVGEREGGGAEADAGEEVPRIPAPSAEGQSGGSPRPGGRVGGDAGNGKRPPKGGSKPANEPEGTTKDSGPDVPVDENAVNHVLPRDANWIPKGAKAKAKANVRAIQLLVKLEKEDRNATPEEKAILAQYTGWGGLKPAVNLDMVAEVALFSSGERYLQNDYYADRRKAVENWKREWGDIHEALKEVLSEQDMKQAFQSSEYAHYSDRVPINFMWDLAKQLGFKGGKVLESAVGVGNFIGLAPADIRDNLDWLAIDKDSVSARIAAKLYPQADVRHSGYEDVKIRPNSLDLVITNVPFGQVSPYDKRYPTSLNLHNYFLIRGLDELKPGGLMLAITSAWTMDSASTDARKLMAERADLLGAIRLPNTAFKENAGTSVVTDILVFRKKDHVRMEPKPFVSTAGAKTVEGYESFPVNYKGSIEEWFALTDEQRKEEIRVSKLKSNLDKNKGKFIQEQEFRVNEYFAGNPNSVAGQLSLKGSMYAKNEMTVLPNDDLSLEEYLQGILAMNPISQTFPQNVFGAEASSGVKEKKAKEGARSGRLELEDEAPSFADQFGKLQQPEWWKKADAARKKELLAQTRSYFAVRGAIEDLITAQSVKSDAGLLSEKRAKLNEVYDAYVKKYGNVRGAGTAILSNSDRDFPIVGALESARQATDKEATALAEKQKIPKSKQAAFIRKKHFVYEKMPIFTEATTRPIEKPTKASSLPDAIAISTSWLGRIDLDYVASMVGKTKEEVAASFRKDGLAFENPKSGEWEPPFRYLSGLVVEKLAEAEAAAEIDPEFETNAVALRAVQPEDVPLESILNPGENAEDRPSIGSQWIPTRLYESFAQEELGLPVSVRFLEDVSMFVVDYDTKTKAYEGLKNTDTWAVRHPNDVGNRSAGQIALTGAELFERMLTQRGAAIEWTQTVDGIKFSHEDPEAGDIAAAKMAALNERFIELIKKAPKAGSLVEQAWNKRFNIAVRTKWPDAPSLRFPGMTEFLTRDGIKKLFQLYAHQARAVLRGVQESTMFAHGVGFGKTFVIISLAKELKRLGLANKPIVVTTTSTRLQIVKEAKMLYPDIKLHVASDIDLTDAASRKIFMAQAMMGDFDMVIVHHKMMDMIPNDPEREKAWIESELSELIAARDAALERDGPQSQAAKKYNNLITSQQKKMQALLDRPKDDALTFEKIGFDAILVDESHYYKKLPFRSVLASRRDISIKGIDTGDNTGAGPSLYMKARYVQELNGGRGVHFFTGTPVTNTIAELWNIIRFLRPAIIHAFGMKNFDAFQTNFTALRSQFERTSTGAYKPVTRLTAFRYMRKLMDAWLQTADVQMNAKDIGVELPGVKGGGPMVRSLSTSDGQLDFVRWLAKEYDKWENMDHSERVAKKLQAIPAKIAAWAKLGAMDLRYIDDRFPDDPDSKVNQAIRDVKRIYDETTGLSMVDEDGVTHTTNGAQFIFCDQIRSANKAINIYEDIKKKLVAQGIPENEIALVHPVYMKSQVTKNKSIDDVRQEIFERLNKGEIRVAIGSTAALGTGVNAQKSAAGLHHLDAPWRPDQITQREARAIRQGNEIWEKFGREVEVNRWVVEGSFDGTLWGIITAKAEMVGKVIDGSFDGDVISDLGEQTTMSFTQVKAAAVGDPRIFRKEELVPRLKQLKNELDEFSKQQRRYADTQQRLEDTIPKTEANLKRDQGLADSYRDLLKEGTEPTVVIDGKTHTGKEAANKALEDFFASKKKDAPKSVRDVELDSSWKNYHPGGWATGGHYIRPVGVIELNGKSIGVSATIHTGANDGVSFLDGDMKFEVRFTENPSTEKHTGSTEGSPSGFYAAVRHLIGSIEREPARVQAALDGMKRDLAEAKAHAEDQWPKHQTLEVLAKEMAELEESFMNSPVPALIDPTGSYPDIFMPSAELHALTRQRLKDEGREDDDDDDEGAFKDDDDIQESRVPSGPMASTPSSGRTVSPPQSPSPIAPRAPSGRSKLNITALVQMLTDLDSNVAVNQRLRRALGRYKLSLNRVELMARLLWDTELAERVLAHEVGHMIDLAIEAKGKGLSFARKIKPLEQFKKKIKDSAELKKQAKALSAEWRGPFDANDTYRNSANELFADYMSAMFNDPELVNTKYALLHDTFQALLDGKPDFAAAYKVLTDRITGKGIAKEWVDRTMEVTDTSIEELTSHERKSWGEFWRNFKDGMAGMFVSPVHRLNETQGKELSRDLGRTMMDTLEYASLFAAKENAFFEDDFRKNVAPHLAQISDDVTEAFKLLDVYVQANRTINERRAAGKWIEQNHEDEARKLLLGLVDQDTGLEKWVPVIKEAPSDQLYDIAARIFREVHQGGESSVARMERRINRMELEITGEAAMLAFNVRGKLLNPKGITPETAKEAIAELRSRVTPEQFAAIEAAQRELANLLFTIQYKAFNEGLMSARAFNEIVLPNKDNYAPYVVLDYFTGQLTAGMAQQKGTARDVMNTVLATQLKAGAINGWRKSQYFTAMLMLAYENSGKDTKLGEALKRASDIEDVRAKHRDDDISRLVWYKDGTPHVMEFPNDPGKTYEQASTAPTRWESLEALGPVSNVASGALQVFTGWSLPFMLWGNLIRDLSTTADRVGWLATIQSMAKGGHKDFEKLRLARNFARAAYGGILDPKVRELIAKDILQPPRTSTAIVFDNENRRELLAAGTIMAYNLTRHQLGSKAANKAKAWLGLNKLTRASMMYEALAKLHALDVARAAGHDEHTAAALARRAGISKPTVSGANRYVNAAMELFHPWTRVMIQGNRASYNVLMNPSTGKGFAARFVAAQLGWKITAASIKWGVPFMLYAWLAGGDDDEEEKEAKTKGALAVFGQAMMRISPYKMGMGTVMPIMFYDPRTGEYRDFQEFWDDATKIPAHYETVSIRIPASEEGKMFGPLFYNAMVSGDEELRMPGMDIGGAIRSWVKNQALPGDNPFIEVGGNTFSMLFGENPDNDFTGYPAANPLLYDAGWGAGRGEAIIGYILANTGFPSAVAGKIAANTGVLDDRALNTFSRRLSTDQKTIVDEIPGMGSLITYDNYQPTRERGEKRVEHAEVEARAKMILPAEYKEMLDFYHRNKGRQDTMDAYELTRFIAAQGFVNTWGDVTNPESDYGGGGDTLNVERARILASGEVRIDAPTLHAKAVWAEVNGASQQLKDSIAADVEELGGMWLGLFQQPQQFIDNMRSPEAK